MGARLALAVVLAVVWCAIAGSSALASGAQESIFQDDDALLHDTDQAGDRVLAELKDLGVDRVRLSVIWRNIAPGAESLDRPHGFDDASDPRAYPRQQFDKLDHVVRVARRYGIEVLLNVRGPAPDWALGRLPNGRPYGRDAYKPSPAGFAQFVQMLGRRYDGTYPDENQGTKVLPRVGAWSIWNEPNWGGHLQPQSERSPRLRRLHTVAPYWYRRLYRAALDGLAKSGHDGDIVLLGETAPLGNAKLGMQSHLKPGRFLRDLFCLDGRLKPLAARPAKHAGCDFGSRGPLKATGYAHHPYSVTAPPGTPTNDRDQITLADADRLKAILDAAARAGRLTPNLPIWYTEFGYQTSPPDPFRGVPLDAQARWLMDAEYMTWKDRRVAGMTQFLLRDDEPRTGFAATDPRHWATYQSGLTFSDGRPKPAYDAYRLPVRAVPSGASGPLELWGMVRPGVNGSEQRVRIQHLAPGASDWTTLAEVGVRDARGYFVERIDRPQPGSYRFQWLRPDPGPPLGGVGGDSSVRLFPHYRAVPSVTVPSPAG